MPSLKQIISLSVVLSTLYGALRVGEWAFQEYLDAQYELSGGGNARLDYAIIGLDVFTTLILWAASIIFNNLEFFDAYYSLGPLHHAYFVYRQVRASEARNGSGSNADEVASSFNFRDVFFLALVTIWGVRVFTVIFARWSGFPEQDWRLEAAEQRFYRRRYGVDGTGKILRPKSLAKRISAKAIYWCTSGFFFVAVNCLAVTYLTQPIASYLYAQKGAQRVTIQELFGLGVMALGLLIESSADLQMARYKRTPAAVRPPILDSGLRRYVRYPQYLGEATFWAGVYLTALPFFSAPGGETRYAHFPIGVALLTLFLHYSAFLTDRRMKARQAYQAYQKKVPFYLVPWFRFGK